MAFPGTLLRVIVLALDTTTPRGSLALWRDGVSALEPTDPRRPFSDQLPGAIARLLRAEGLAVPDVDVFGVASGPGSLTGLRVGIGTVQGLAFATGRPAVAVSALEALAIAGVREVPSLAAGECAGAWIDAHRNEVFAALYELASDGSGPDPLRPVDGPSVGQAADIAAGWMPLVRGRRCCVAGGAAKANAQLLARHLGLTTTVTAGPLLAGIVAEVAAHRAARGECVHPHGLQPLYVRRPDAEVARDRLRAQRQ